jgi:FkbM family methyltransferase
MQSCLVWLKAWIARYRVDSQHDVGHTINGAAVRTELPAPSPRSTGPRFGQLVVALATTPVVLIIYGILLITAFRRGPLRLTGSIPGGACIHCQLPDVVQLYAFLFGVWEPDISDFIQRRLSPGDTFVDVGAHVGYYSLLASARVGSVGRVVAIEASPSIFHQLKENLAANGEANIRAVNVAASADRGVMNVHRGPPWNLGLSTTRQSGGLPLECQVEALPLDAIVTSEERQAVRLVKVDVEGAERDLFGGLIRLLRDARSDAEIVLELSPRWWKDTTMTVEQALQPFTDAGYHTYLVNNDYSPWRYFWSDTVRPPRRARQPLKSWLGQYDVVLSRVDQEEL